MTSTPSLSNDAESLTALLVDQPAAVENLTFSDKQLRFLTPANGNYTQNISFDFHGIDKVWTEWRDAFLYLPLQIQCEAALVPSPLYPPIAFKSSVLSAIQQVVVRTMGSGGLNINHGANSLAFANHLRLAMLEDQDWLQAVGPELHFSRDRAHPGVVGLKSLDEILYPNVSPYTAVVAPGTAAQSGDFLNPAYNVGFKERNAHLMRSLVSDTGVMPALNTQSLRFVARIPLRVIDDFFRELGESGPLFNMRLQMEFWLASKLNNTGFSPITIGSVVGNGSGPSTQSAGGIVDIRVDPNSAEGPRLYYHEVSLRKEHADLAGMRMASGFQKRLLFREYDVIKDFNYQQNLSNANTFTHRVSGAVTAIQRLWILCYPTGAVAGNGWPSVLVTGPSGMTNINVMLNGKNYLNSPLSTLEEQYEQLKDASHIGADSGERECMIPFQDFRTTSRLVTVDMTRSTNLLADPNGALDLQVSGTIKSPYPVDVVYVVERLHECVFDYTGGVVRTSVGPALVR